MKINYKAQNQLEIEKNLTEDKSRASSSSDLFLEKRAETERRYWERGKEWKLKEEMDRRRPKRLLEWKEDRGRREVVGLSLRRDDNGGLKMLLVAVVAATPAIIRCCVGVGVGLWFVAPFL